MNGEVFKQAIESDGRDKKDIAKLLGIDRQKLNHFEKYMVIPDDIIAKGKEIGLKFNENVTTRRDISSPTEVLEIAERMVDNATKQLTDQHNRVVDELKRVLRVYEGIMKKNKILN